MEQARYPVYQLLVTVVQSYVDLLDNFSTQLSAAQESSNSSKLGPSSSSYIPGNSPGNSTDGIIESLEYKLHSSISLYSGILFHTCLPKLRKIGKEYARMHQDCMKLLQDCWGNLSLQLFAVQVDSVFSRMAVRLSRMQEAERKERIKCIIGDLLL